jgi:hypothetical protein
MIDDRSISFCRCGVECKNGRIRLIMKLHISRNGEVLGGWTKTQLYGLVRASEASPSDYYWHEGMTELHAAWKKGPKCKC